MQLQNSPFAIQDKNIRNFDKTKHQTTNDLIGDHKVPNKNVNTVHRRRDLDSLG